MECRTTNDAWVRVIERVGEHFACGVKVGVECGVQAARERPFIGCLGDNAMWVASLDVRVVSLACLTRLSGLGSPPRLKREGAFYNLSSTRSHALSLPVREPYEYRTVSYN